MSFTLTALVVLWVGATLGLGAGHLLRFRKAASAADAPFGKIAARAARGGLAAVPLASGKRVARDVTTKPKRARPYWVDPASSGTPYGATVEGLLTFRGNPTRTYHGQGPMPSQPEVLWRYPAKKPMCAKSFVGKVGQVWCGTGWTGQPAVFEREGRTWLVFGAYDKGVHFLDANTGRALRPTLYTGDIIKGSVTIDPDGFPLAYVGSRDGYYRAIAFDRPVPQTLWRLSAAAVRPTLWNDDWDGAGLVLGDHLLVGGENSQLHVVRLNRGYDKKGRVSLAPSLKFNAPGWDKALLGKIGDRNVSIEGSVAMSGDTVYFANSGGLVQGWDMGTLRQGGIPQKVFSFWTGDDTDSTIVVDAAQNLYVSSEYERHNRRSKAVGQIMRLDPTRADPLVWSVHDRGYPKGGVWATPALYEDLVITATHKGEILGIHKDTGKVRWRLKKQGKTWQSPVVVDGVLLQGDCSGRLTAYDLRNPTRTPELLWELNLGACIESTPAVWRGRIYVGTRGGFVYALGDVRGRTDTPPLNTTSRK